MLLSVQLALEYEAVLMRQEQLAASGSNVRDVEKLLGAIIAVSEPVYRTFFWRPLLRDADDDMVLETAVSGWADAIVTFNRKDFEPSPFPIRIEDPRWALRTIRAFSQMA